MGKTARAATVGRRWIRNLWLNGVVASHLVPEHLRWALLRLSGLRTQRSIIESGGYYGGTNISIGRGSYLNRGVFLDGSAAIDIGAGVSFGMNVLVITGSHDIGPRSKRAGDLHAMPVRVGNGAWIGAGSTILPGVIIGDGAVIGAGSVVTKDVTADSVVAGNPARLVRDLSAADDRRP